MPKGLYKIKFASDTTKPRLDTLMKFKRVIGDTSEQMNKAKALGLSNQNVKSKLAEKIKAKKN
jgi:hypothetical protein